jgi:hypothetical protein
MKRVSMVVVLALVAALVAAPALAAPTKWVRGPVTAMTGDSVTVTVKGEAATYKVDSNTVLVARGAGTAQAQGGKGIKLADFVKVGQYVEVRYTETAGAKVASEVRPLMAEEESASKEQGATVSGNTSTAGSIVSIVADSIVISADGKDLKFTVTPKTTVLGPGMGTKARELKEQGKPSVITAFLGPKDQVVVYYTEGPSPTATSIRLLMKVAK